MCTETTQGSPDYHTNVRTITEASAQPGAPAASPPHAGWQLLAALLPAAAERAAITRFVAPPITPPAPPRVAGLRTHSFWVDSPSGRLCAYDWGDRGPTVLLAHGWGGTAVQLGGFVRPLLDAGFHVLAFDQPAHGASVGRRATVLDFAGATAAVAAKVDRVHGVIAHSLGATGAALALGSVAARLALLAPPVAQPWLARACAAALGLPPPRIDGMLRRLEAALGSFDALDLRLRAPRFTSSALIVHDPCDREVPYDQSRSLALAWPAARLHRVDHGGHRSLPSDPGVIRAVVDFMRPGADLQRLSA